MFIKNSTPSPHRTPPPQRQGVIQRHNAGGSKPPSPAPNRMHIMPQHHYAMPGINELQSYQRSTISQNDARHSMKIDLNIAGHEAFSSLVDVAVQQPLLPVPHKDEKRPNVPVSEPAPHHEIRYHPHIGKICESIHLVYFFLFNLFN